jgi:hypothetical protein
MTVGYAPYQIRFSWPKAFSREDRAKLANFLYSKTKGVYHMTNETDHDTSKTKGKSRPKAKKSRGRSYDGWQFVNVYLNSEQKDHISGEQEDGHKLMEWLWTCLEQGYKFSLTYDVRRDAFIASLSGKETTCPNYQKTVTAWASDPLKATGVLQFKIEVILGEGEWSDLHTEDQLG